MKSGLIRFEDWTDPVPAVRREVISVLPDNSEISGESARWREGLPPVLFVGTGYGHWVKRAAERGFPAHALTPRAGGDLRAHVHDVVQTAAGLPRQTVLIGHGIHARVVAHALGRYPARAFVLAAPVLDGWATLAAALRTNPIGALPALVGGRLRLSRRQLFDPGSAAGTVRSAGTEGAGAAPRPAGRASETAAVRSAGPQSDEAAPRPSGSGADDPEPSRRAGPEADDPALNAFGSAAEEAGLRNRGSGAAPGSADGYSARPRRRDLFAGGPPPRPVGRPAGLVLGSPDDRVVPRASLDRAAARYGGAPLLFPGMGHALMLDAAWAEPIDAICDWLTKELAASV